MNRREATSAIVGALLSAAAFAGVQRGKLALAEAAPPRVAVAEAAPAGPSRKPETCEAEMAANRNLVDQVHEYQARFDQLQEEKGTDSVVAVAAPSVGEGEETAAPVKSEWDSSPEELTELAKMGTVKLRAPCGDPNNWRPNADVMQGLGLAPTDALVIERAAARAYRESWKEIEPLCTELRDAPSSGLNRDDCVSAVFASFRASDAAGTAQAMQHIADVRAGLRPAPWTGDRRLHPVEKVGLILAEAQKSYEQEIARTLGPDDAHRVAYSDSLCASYTLWEGYSEAID